jgi:hypothetical protein
MSNKIKWIAPQQQYAFCALSVIPVRTEPSDAAEICTQLLFGETIEVLEYSQPWLKIQNLQDGYIGYIDFKQVLPLTAKELRRWQDEAEVSSEFSSKLIGPNGAFNITGGALIGASPLFQIGAYEFQQPEDSKQLALLNKANIWNYILSFLNTPYLWGGRSHFGIDCSGFVQNVFRQLELKLPRDAYQQAELGADIHFEEKQALDVAFFINAKEKIHHVGIIMADGNIIHASGQVRIDALTQTGIFNEAGQCQTHQLHCIKRFID